MKGVVLCGGAGTRLSPMTQIINKHLLDVYDEPMVFYPIRKLIEAGINDIIIVTGDQIGQFKKLLASENFEAKFSFCYQEGESGIADAILKAESFLGYDRFCVILGDNIFDFPIIKQAELFKGQRNATTHIVLYDVKDDDDAKRFGCAAFTNERLVSIAEKPQFPSSTLVQTGVYFYDNSVFRLIKSLEPSYRGELEVTDLNNIYIRAGNAEWSVLEGFWSDAGTHESKLRASIHMAHLKGLKLPE